MQRIRKYFFPLFLLASTLALFSFGRHEATNDDLIKRIIGQLKKFKYQNLQQKVYLHLDKLVYASGETIWFKGYLVNGDTHTADTLNGTLYVDLISPSNKIIAQRVLRLDKGLTHGDFTVTDSLPTGTYRIRAYTNWMRNFNPDYFFTKSFSVWNTESTSRSAEAGQPGNVSGTAGKPDVQFFPEGGQQVAGLESRVAFKAVNASGKGIAVAGSVIDEKGATVLSFKSMHLGMGVFTLKPEDGKQYTARVQTQEGAFMDYPLPQASGSGYVVAAYTTFKNAIRVAIQRKTPAPESTPAQVLLVAQVRGVICYMANATLTNSTFVADIPKSKFPSGIVHLTLFSSQGEPQCERLVFVSHPQPVTLKISTPKPVYAPREKVAMQVQVSDQMGNPVQANLSLAVTDALQVKPEPLADNILMNLLLTSDLQGTIEQPGFYFKDEEPQTVAALDNLMLTQGWRRFIWKELLADQLVETKYLIEQGFSIRGQVLRPNQKPVAGSHVTLYTKGADQQFALADTDEQGRFFFGDYTWLDSTQVLLQAVTAKGNRDLQVLVDETLPPVVKKYHPPFMPERDAAMEGYLHKSKQRNDLHKQFKLDSATIQLQTVTVKAKKVQQQDSRKLYGAADAVVKADDSWAGYFTVLQALQGRVAGVSVTGSGMNMDVRIRGNNAPPLFLLDGIPTDQDMIMNIPVNDVEAIEVLKGASTAIYGGRGGGGVIAILTKRGNPNYDYAKDKALGTRIFIKSGYYKACQFYVPRYDTLQPSHSRPDSRSAPRFTGTR